MNYPSLEEVEKASRTEWARWSRHLPSPGQNWLDSEEYEDKLISESAVLNRILELFQNSGGWTPALSRCVGWD
jgi:hypothetical protein